MITTPFPVTPVYEVAPPVIEGEIVVRGTDGVPAGSRPRMMRRPVVEETAGTASGSKGGDRA